MFRALSAFRLPLPARLIVMMSLAGLCIGSGSAGERVVQGSVSLPNSGAATAQDAFLYGLAQLHNFQFDDAAAAFREAQQIDTGFAMAYWGEAMTYNHPLWAQQDRGAALAVLHRLGDTAEARQASAPTQREKDYLNAIEILYGEGDKHRRDNAYSAELGRLHEKYPDDQELAAFYALSILGTAHEGRDYAVYMRAAAIVQEVFRVNPEHPGAAHYLIHSFDDPVHAPLGLRAALSYSEIAPEAPHAQHMTSHIFLALGRWDDVVRANQRAVAEISRARQTSGQPPYHCGHYNIWLAYGYEQAGDATAAIDLLRNCRRDVQTIGAQEPSIDADNTALHSFIYMRSRYLIDSEDWNGEVAEWRVDIPDGFVPEQITWEFIEGLAAARRGDLAEARRRFANLNQATEDFAAYLGTTDYDASRLDKARPGILLQQLEGLMLFANGQKEAGMNKLQAAADAEAALPLHYGPPAIEQPGYELLGSALREAGQGDEARQAYVLAHDRTPGRRAARQGINEKILPR
jgi:hypothetical protein